MILITAFVVDLTLPIVLSSQYSFQLLMTSSCDSAIVFLHQNPLLSSGAAVTLSLMPLLTSFSISDNVT